MDSAKQTIRWALPGLLFAFFWLMFVTVNWSFSKLFEYPDKDFLYATITTANQIILPLTLASIPAGFLIYQIYYFVYWKAPIPSFLKFIIDSPDRGRYILKDVEDLHRFKQSFHSRLKTPPDSAYLRKKVWRDHKIMREYLDNWHLSDSVWYTVLKQGGNKTVLDILEKRNQMLADIYHTLGVAYFSLILSFSLYSAYILYVAIRKNQMMWQYPLWGFLLNIIIFIIILLSLRAGRVNSYEALTTLKRDVINEYFYFPLSEESSNEMEKK